VTFQELEEEVAAAKLGTYTYDAVTSWTTRNTITNNNIRHLFRFTSASQKNDVVRKNIAIREMEGDMKQPQQYQP
jgi:hypothetical protein